MECPPLSEFAEETDAKPSFHKPSNDASGRRYRRHSPARGSDSSENESSKHGKHRRMSSREDNAKFSERRRNDGRELHQEYHNRHGKESNSMKSDRDSRYHRNHHGKDHGGRDDRRDRRDRSPEKYKNDGKYSYKYRDGGSTYLKSTERGRIEQEETMNRRRYEKERDRDRNKCRWETEDEIKKKKFLSSGRDNGVRNDPDKNVDTREDYRASKKYKSSHSENDYRSADDEKLSSKSKAADKDETHDTTTKEVKATVSKFSPGPIGSSSSHAEAVPDVSAAKVAAMKAAELVNRNIGGAGLLSTDQKKKLLWGNKKNNATEESAGCWDVPLFSDRERQEKFNKLMGVKGDPKMELKVEDKHDSLQAEKQEQLQMDLEKQYTAGLRRRDGRTVGLGL